MYKVLIIDDEKPVRQVIAALGRWKEQNIVELFEAVEGNQGMQMIREKRPDIVFVDMKMPVMDGVDFLKLATKEYPGTKYIVVSGYNDFEYTKQAIRSKVLDYLLKPISETDLNNAISKAVEELDRDKLNDKDSEKENVYKNIAYNMSVAIIKENVITAIIQDNITSVERENFRKYICNSSNSKYLYGISIINLINFNEVYRNVFDRDASAALFACTNVIDELCAEWCKGFSFRSGGIAREIIVVIAVDPNTELGFIAHKFRDIVEKLQSLFHIYSVASIGKLSEEFARLKESYTYAGTILNSINMLSNKESVYIEMESESRAHRETLMGKKELLIHAFEEGSLDYAKKIIYEYMHNIAESRYYSLEDFQKIMMEFTLLIGEIVEYFGIPNYEIIPDMRNGYLYSYSNLEDVNKYIYLLMDKVYDKVRSNIKASEKSNIYKIKEYIDTYYFKEIKLTTFSEMFYLSKEYLSKLFKNEFGASIYEYVLKVRMEMAKKMLSDSNIKIQTICESIGYNDANYFSKAFKSLYNVSPSEYRDSLQ